MTPLGDFGSVTPLTHQAQRAMAAWIRHQLEMQGRTLSTLADQASLTEGYLNRALSGEVSPRLGRWLSLAHLLGTGPTDFIAEIGLISDRAIPYLELCRSCSQDPLSVLWNATRDLPAADRVILLECVRYLRTQVTDYSLE